MARTVRKGLPARAGRKVPKDSPGQKGRSVPKAHPVRPVQWDQSGFKGSKDQPDRKA